MPVIFDHEQKIRDEFKDIEKSVFIDVGANIGQWATDFARFFELVICFEPHPEAFRELALNMHEFKNFRLVNKALSNNTGIKPMKIFPHSSHSTLESEHPHKVSGRQEIIMVEATTLDEYLRENPIPDGMKVSLIKIDTEGHEKMVLEGCAETIKKYNPVMYVENH